jgi:MoaA/NifB/PqqE/SkfB family radical SAM enzyme
LIEPEAARPGWFEFELVRSCDYRCLHCDAWRRRDPEGSLRYEEWVALARQAAALSPGAPLAVTTGEPYLYPRLLDFIAEATNAGLETYLNTHGGLLDDSAVDRTIASGLRALWVSLDGATEATHDFGRGIAGAHRAAVAALRRLTRRGYRRAGIVTIVMSHNLGELADLARRAGDWGLRGVMLQPLQPYGPDWRRCRPEPGAARRALAAVESARRSGAPVVNPPEHLEAIARYYEGQNEFSGLQCRSTRTMIVENDGVVRVCRYWGTAGLTRGRALADIWRTSEARALSREAASCAKSCLLMGCHYPFPASSFM